MTGDYPADQRILLVGGRDDKHAVWQICHRTPSSFTITVKDSFSAVLDAIETEILSPGRQA